MATTETTPIKSTTTISSPETNNNQLQRTNSLFYFELDDVFRANAPDNNEDMPDLLNRDNDFPSFEIVSAGAKSNYDKLRQRIQRVQDDVRGRYHVLKKRSVGHRTQKIPKKERAVSVTEPPVSLIRHVKYVGTGVPGDSFRPRPFSADRVVRSTEGSITRQIGAGQRVLRDSVMTRGSESPDYIEINECDEGTFRSKSQPPPLPTVLSYEHMRPESVSGDDDSSDIGWSDSEFDDSFASAEDDEEEEKDGGIALRLKDEELADHESTTPTSKTVRLSDAGHAKRTPNTRADGQLGIIRRLKDSFRSKGSVESDEDKAFLPIRICEEKHPPPELPPLPAVMSPDQLKRRHVLGSIVQSERSYILSLQRILEVYREPLLEVPLLKRGKVHLIFTRVEEILQSHLMFQIELAEKVQTWHQDEKIGDVFFAAFYKSMVVESYSEYVNNFTAAMEDIKAVSRQQKALSDFLTMQQTNSADRLSIFGLMVKPVQRFPQFIMLIQDMLKYTPEDHHDRLNLQRALTELEGVAFKLNERKRDSEQRLAAKQTLSSFREPWQSLAAKIGTEKVGRLLIRQDSFYQVSNQGGSLRYKQRRLFLMNDILLCANVERRERDGETVERYRLKWSAPLTDVDIKESAITSALQSSITGEAGSFCIVSPKLSVQTDDLFHLYSDLNELIHDYTVLGQTARLISSLKREYQDLSEELVHGIMRDMQRNIQMKDEQAHLVNSCSITIMLPVRGTVCKVIFQSPTPECKDDWCLDLTVARLALDPKNTPSWDINSTGDQTICNSMPTLFMKSLQVDIPRYFTKIECAVPVYMSMTDNTHISVQHLWICANTDNHGHVSIVSIHRNRARVIESFTACDCQIVCVEMVSGYSVTADGDLTKQEYEFADNTVWMGTDKGEFSE